MFSFVAVSNATQINSSINLKLEGATYFGIYDHAISLKHGRWMGKPFDIGGASRPMVKLIEGFYLEGDLDGDGLVEYVGILQENSGGSATQMYLAVMHLQAGKLINLSTVFIGDRIQIQAGRIFNGQLELDTIQHGKEDPACCPSRKVIQTWRLDGGVLKAFKNEGAELN
jgi:hypothetical protein